MYWKESSNTIVNNLKLKAYGGLQVIGPTLLTTNITL